MRCRGGGMARRNTLRALLAGLRCVGLRLDATAPPSLHVTLARIGTIIRSSLFSPKKKRLTGWKSAPKTQHWNSSATQLKTVNFPSCVEPWARLCLQQERRPGRFLPMWMMESALTVLHCNIHREWNNNISVSISSVSQRGASTDPPRCSSFLLSFSVFLQRCCRANPK